MMSMTVTVTGGPRLEELSTAELARVLGDGLKSGGLVVQNAAKVNAPVKEGALRRSLHMEQTAPLEVTVGTDLVYAAIQEFGGYVSPRNAQFLHFFVDGVEVFTRGPVYIPPQPYLRPALDENKDNVAREVQASVDAALRRAA